MSKIIHRADSRGVADHGWLYSRHTFSFAGYHNPERMGFGKLRVINDDIVKGGGGFGTRSARQHGNHFRAARRRTASPRQYGQQPSDTGGEVKTLMSRARVDAFPNTTTTAPYQSR